MGDISPRKRWRPEEPLPPHVVAVVDDYQRTPVEDIWDPDLRERGEAAEVSHVKLYSAALWPWPHKPADAKNPDRWNELWEEWWDHAAVREPLARTEQFDSPAKALWAAAELADQLDYGLVKVISLY
jgi:hypothetical protein